MKALFINDNRYQFGVDETGIATFPDTFLDRMIMDVYDDTREVTKDKFVTNYLDYDKTYLPSEANGLYDFCIGCVLQNTPLFADAFRLLWKNCPDDEPDTDEEQEEKE